MIVLRPDLVERLRGDTTQAELARKAGISRSTVIRIEAGQTAAVTFETVNRLAKALGVDADKLVTFETVDEVAQRDKRKGRKS